MTPWYDDVVPISGMLPLVGDGGDDACSTCHVHDVHACVYTRMVPSSAAQTWYEGKKSGGRTCYSFVLNPKFRWGIGGGRAHR